MPFHISSAAILAIAITAALPAQGRGRRPPRAETGPEQPAAPATTPAADAAPAQPVKHLAIVGGDVYLGTGQRLTGATVLIADQKILAVGHNLKLPDGTETIDARGQSVSPGFVAVQAAGMGATGGSPYADSVNPFDPQIKQGLAAGITAFLVGSTGGRGPTPGAGNAVIKLAYGDAGSMVLREDPVAGINVPLSSTEREQFRDSVKQAREYLQAVADYQARKSADPKTKEPEMPRGAEKLVAILKGEVVLWVNLGGGGSNPFGGGRRGGGSNNDVDAIRQALEIAKELGRGVVLQKPISAWLLPDEIAATGSMVVLSPRTRVAADPRDPDRTGSNLATAAILGAAGVPVAVTCPSGLFGGASVGTGGILGQDLNTPHIDAAYAIRGGMDRRKALRTLTLDSARMIGAGDRIGSLEPGKDADVLILDGDPLHYSTFVTTAVVNGKVVYEKAKEPLYRHIER